MKNGKMAKILHADLWISVIMGIHIIWNGISEKFSLRSMDIYVHIGQMCMWVSDKSNEKLEK